MKINIYFYPLNWTYFGGFGRQIVSNYMKNINQKYFQANTNVAY